MTANHQISSNVYDRYHGAAKAKDLHSQKQNRHGSTRAGSGEEGSKFRPQVRDGFNGSFKPVGSSSGSHQPRDKIGETGHRHDEVDRHGHNRGPDRYDFAGHHPHRQDGVRFLRGKHVRHIPKGTFEPFQGTVQFYQLTKITITHSSVFSGAHLGSPEKTNKAYQDFLDAARSFIQNPGEKAYKSLNDAMTKLLDPKFKPSVIGGAAQVSIRDVNGATMVRFTMEVTPAPTKTLEEAREDLKNAFSSTRDGEKGIADIRAEAHANYIRALSEKFKQDGVISHTNNTPTTPVYKTSVIYIAKATQVNVKGIYEIKKPDFGHNFHGRLTFKNQHGFWNDYRQSHKSYVDMLKHDSRKSHVDKDFKFGKAIGAKHGHHRFGDSKAEKTGRNHHNKARTDKAS